MSCSAGTLVIHHHFMVHIPHKLYCGLNENRPEFSLNEEREKYMMCVDPELHCEVQYTSVKCRVQVLLQTELRFQDD